MKAITGILFILILNVLFTFVNLGIADIRGDNNLQLGVDSSMFNEYNTGTGGHYVVKAADTSELPTKQGVTDQITGGVFTDLWMTISNWFSNVVGAGKVLLNFINAVPNFLQSIGLPEQVYFMIGTLWHILTVFLVVMFWRGD